MAHNPEADLETLELCMREGIAGGEYADPREELGLSADADDREVAREALAAVGFEGGCRAGA